MRIVLHAVEKMLGLATPGHRRYFHLDQFKTHETFVKLVNTADIAAGQCQVMVRHVPLLLLPSGIDHAHGILPRSRRRRDLQDALRDVIIFQPQRPRHHRVHIIERGDVG